jgi:adenylate kinase
MIRGVRLVILGKQGAGKGTQCVRLARHYVVPHVSTGDIFRAARKSGTELGRLADSYMSRGELVPDEVTIGIVAERLAERDARGRGFILDGFPRTVHQAQALEKILSPVTLDAVFDLEVPTEVVLGRLASRRVCKDCGANYSVQQRPKYNWICDACTGEVVQRDDDKPDAIRRRLELYEQQTSPLIEFYDQRALLIPLDGSLGTEDVFDHMVDVLDRRRGA